MKIRARLAPFALAALLGGCSSLPFLARPEAVAPVAAPVAEAPVIAVAPAPPAGAKTAAALDTTSAADKAAALAPPEKPAGAQALGSTAVALGNVTEPGFWLRSSLVSAPGKGRVVTASGGTLSVDLLPGSGAAQLSLSAFRALNLPLTGLPEVTIFAE